LKVCFQSQQLAVLKLFAWPTSGNDLKIMNFTVITEQTTFAATQNQIPFHHFRQHQPVKCLLMELHALVLARKNLKPQHSVK